MGIEMFEAVVKHGQIELTSDIHLVENTKVYVIVPRAEPAKTAHVYSPRLKYSSCADDFRMEVIDQDVSRIH
jgi:hypothetical protein